MILTIISKKRLRCDSIIVLSDDIKYVSVHRFMSCEDDELVGFGSSCHPDGLSSITETVSKHLIIEFEQMNFG